MGNQLAAALDMARRGFRVFPCVPYGKKPAIENWTSLATSDEAQIRAWFIDRPDYNYGIATTGFVVPDVDISKVGRETALANYAGLGGHFDTFTVQTPTEGYHCYFEGPDSGLRVNLVPGVDIRSHNGYVVGPGCYTDPARTDDTSVKAVGWYAVVHDLELAWVPPGIEIRLRPPGERREHVDYSIELDTPTAISNAQAWLLLTSPAIEGLGGDNQTYIVCAKLVRDFALSPEKAFELLCAGWNERCSPPWPLEQLWVKVKNAADYGTAPLGGARPEATFGIVTVPSVPLQWYQQPAIEHGIYLGNALDPSSLEARRWLAERLLIRGEVTVMAAAGAAGKSITSLTVAAHYAVGLDYGPYKLKIKGKPQRIFIYNGEDDIAEQTRRLLAICATYKLDYEMVRANIMLMDNSMGDLILAAAERNVAHENTLIVDFLIDLLLTNEIDIAIFDPLINLHQCSENDNVHMRFVIGFVLRRIARKSNTALMVAHHVSKGNSKEAGNADDIRGAGGIINSARIAVMLSGPTDKDLSLLGIDVTVRHSYVRIDDAKANLFLKSGVAIMWTKWEGVRIATGDIVGVPIALEVDIAKEAERTRIGEIIYRQMIIEGRATALVADAVRWLRAEDEMYNAMCDKNDTALRRLVQNMLMRPLTVEDNVQLVLTGAAGKPLIQIM